MAKVKESMMKGKSKSTAMVPAGESAFARKQAAMGLFAGKTYEQVERAAEGEIREDEKREKETLVGVPFILFAIEERTGDHMDKETGEYATYFVLSGRASDTNENFITTDGGVGIRVQVQEMLTPTGNNTGLVASWVASSLEECIRVPGGMNPGKEYLNRDGIPSRTYRLAQHAPKLVAAGAGNGRARAQA